MIDALAQVVGEESMEPGRRELFDPSESNAPEPAVSDLHRAGDQKLALGTAATAADCQIILAVAGKDGLVGLDQVFDRRALGTDAWQGAAWRAGAKPTCRIPDEAAFVAAGLGFRWIGRSSDKPPQNQTVRLSFDPCMMVPAVTEFCFQ